MFLAWLIGLVAVVAVWAWMAETKWGRWCCIALVNIPIIGLAITALGHEDWGVRNLAIQTILLWMYAGYHTWMIDGKKPSYIFLVNPDPQDVQYVKDNGKPLCDSQKTNDGK